jgi:predicted transcriptional regulator
MTTHAAIINGVQANMLQALREANPEPLNCTQIGAASGIARTLTGRNLKDLAERGIVDVLKKTASTHAYRYLINDTGRRALGRYKRRQEQAEQPQPVQANCTSLFAMPVYTPPAQAYYRNNGNYHIASRGVGC